MIRLIFLISLVSTSLWADPGFYSTGSSEIPKLISDKAPSVYRVYILGFKPASWIPANEVGSYQREYEREFSGEKLTWKHFEVKNYFGADGGGSYDVGILSGFNVGNKKTLWTTHHGIGPILRTYPLPRNFLERPSQINLNLVVVDEADRIVFDSRKGPETAKIRFYGHAKHLLRSDDPLALLEPSTAQAIMDVMEIELSRALPAPLLKLASKPSQPGEPVYLVGYPTLTSGRRSNADGAQLYFSAGTIIKTPEFYQEFLERLGNSPELRELYLERNVISDVDAVSGNSGGPLLNNRGEVLGIYSSHWQESPEKSLETTYTPKGGRAICARFLSDFISR